MDTGILYSLISLGDFKAILDIDDRDNALSRFCLITATYTIEQYCKRRLLRWKNTDYLTFAGEYIGHSFALPSLPLLAENGPEALVYSVDSIFREHGLTEREAEVTCLIIMEEFSNQKYPSIDGYNCCWNGDIFLIYYPQNSYSIFMKTNFFEWKCKGVRKRKGDRHQIAG
jgi:hypothetical protein